MKSHLFLILACLFTASCSMNPTGMIPNAMSYDEIIAYNRTVDLWEEIHCQEEIRIGSYIPKRFCGTLRELYYRGSDANQTLSTIDPTGSGFIDFNF